MMRNQKIMLGQLSGGVPSSRLTGISAVCRMIDFPIVLSYELFAKNKNSVYSSLGVSTYKMLNERYDYHYENDADPKNKWENWERNTVIMGGRSKFSARIPKEGL